MTTNDISSAPESSLETFIDKLYALHRSLETGNGERAARARLARLRRHFHGDTEAIGWAHLNSAPDDDAQNWAFAAALFALYPQPRVKQNFAQAMGKAAADGNQPVRRRFNRLINAEGDDLLHYLRQSTSLLRGKDLGFNFLSLTHDLNALLPTRRTVSTGNLRDRVRLRWTKDFYRAQRSYPGTATGSHDESE